MKREITAPTATPIKVSAPTKTQERELADVMEYMIEQISKRFKNTAINGLQAATVDKFADAQSGNYANVFLKLAGKVSRMIMRQFDDKRLEEMVSGILNKVDIRSRDEFYSRIENAVGISSKELAATEGMKATTNALKLETIEWVKKLRDQTLEEYTANTLRAMTLGNGLEGILEQYDGLVEKRKNHAKFTARNQINNYNSISTKIRAQNLGITQAIWVTADDERVRGRPGGKYANSRPSHWALHGKVFDLDKGAETSGQFLLPGTTYNCRCTYKLIIPESE